MRWPVLLVLLSGCVQQPQNINSKGQATKYTGGQAFPMHYDSRYKAHAGMEIRDFFAANAPSPPEQYEPLKDETSVQREVRWRWEYADEMLRKR